MAWGKEALPNQPLPDQAEEAGSTLALPLGAKPSEKGKVKAVQINTSPAPIAGCSEAGGAGASSDICFQACFGLLGGGCLALLDHFFSPAVAVKPTMYLLN